MKRSRSLHGQFHTNHLGPIHTNPNTFLTTNRMFGLVWMRPKFCHQVSSCWICSSRMLQRSITRVISGLGRTAFSSSPWSLYQIRVRAKSDINVLFSTYKKKNSFEHEGFSVWKYGSVLHEARKWLSPSDSIQLKMVASCKTVFGSEFRILC